METVSKMKYSRTDRLVLGIGYAILGLFVLSIVVPLVYVVLASFMASGTYSIPITFFAL